MASSLDRSTREANQKKSLLEERKRERKEKKEKATEIRERNETKKEYHNKSAAHFETRSVLKTMLYSSGILLIAFAVFEGLLLLFENIYGTGYADRDLYWHLINIADTCIGFLIGILAMDALTAYNQNERSKREEQRAIIRHNRIVKPCIEMYLARKNCLITPNGEEPKYFQVVSKANVRDLKDIYDVSPIPSDAGRSRIDSFQYFLKKLNNAFLNMAEDIDFDYNPELCDAVTKFLNDTVYGQAATDAMASFGREGNRAQKMNIIRRIKEANPEADVGNVDGDLATAMIFISMIHSQEEALKRYIQIIEEIDTQTKSHRKVR